MRSDAIDIGTALAGFCDRGLEFSLSSGRSGFGMLVMTEDWGAAMLGPDEQEQIADMIASLRSHGFGLRAVRYDFDSNGIYDGITLYGDNPDDFSEAQSVFGRAIRRHCDGSLRSTLYLDLRGLTLSNILNLALEQGQSMGWSNATQTALVRAFDSYAYLGWIQLLGIERVTGSLKIDIAEPNLSKSPFAQTIQLPLRRLAIAPGYVGFRWRDATLPVMTLYDRPRHVYDMAVAIARLMAP